MLMVDHYDGTSEPLNSAEKKALQSDAAAYDALAARLAEADDNLLSVAIELGTTKARLAEARGCFDAALFEGWLDALANGDIERIRDLWTRRISFAMEAVTADSAPVAFWDCDCGQVNDDPTCIRCGATPTVPVAPEAK